MEAAEKVKKARVPTRNYNSFGGFVIRMAHDSKKVGISSKATASLDKIIRDMCIRITGKASNLAGMDRRDTITPRDVTTAVQLMFPGELGHNMSCTISAPVNKVLSARPKRKTK